MRCKDIERLIIDGSEPALSGQDLNAVEMHVDRCLSCARFREDLQRIRSGLRAFSCPSPSGELVKKTRALCHSGMEAVKESGSGDNYRIQPRSVPKFIWAAMVALVILTGILIVSLLPLRFEIEESLSFKAVLAFTLIVQNAAMLFFAPVLIQKFRSPVNRVEMKGYENLVP